MREYMKNRSGQKVNIYKSIDDGLAISNNMYLHWSMETLRINCQHFQMSKRKLKDTCYWSTIT